MCRGVSFVTPECYANSGDYDYNIRVSGPASEVLQILGYSSHTFGLC